MSDATGGALGLRQTAQLVGSYRWTEERLFALSGHWATDAGSPATQLHFDEVSMQHGWHAELWAARLPVLDGFDREAATAPLGAPLGALFDRLEQAGAAAAATTQEGADLARLSGLYRVVIPRLLVTYRRHLLACSAASDRPIARALRLVMRDHAESWVSGEALLQAALHGPSARASLARHLDEFEGPLIESLDGAGLMPWPGKT